MSFLDNSGDIILDAVLTDTGRKRIARGDGSFEISKFAFGDDEIDYSKFDKNHPQGSSHQDVELLKTPILEAVTDNASAVKNKLISISRNDLLYLPEMKLNQVDGSTLRNGTHILGSFVVVADSETEDLFTVPDETEGVMGFDSTQTSAQVDQGLDNGESPSNKLDPELVETQYIVKIDNRLGKIVSAVSDSTTAQPSYIDDDNIASYLFTQGSDSDFIDTLGPGKSSVINGPTGTRMKFKVEPTQQISDSEFLFDRLGSTSQVTSNNDSVKHIDTIVRVMGGSTGKTIDIPFRYVKKS